MRQKSKHRFVPLKRVAGGRLGHQPEAHASQPTNTVWAILHTAENDTETGMCAGFSEVKSSLMSAGSCQTVTEEQPIIKNREDHHHHLVLVSHESTNASRCNAMQLIDSGITLYANRCNTRPYGLPTR